MNPIERAARNLCELAGAKQDGSSQESPDWRDFVPMVQGVLAAIEEPSLAMREIGGEFVRGAHIAHAEAVGEEDAADVWRAMLRTLQADAPGNGVTRGKS